MRRRSKARKILVASIGVAAVLYGCKKNDSGGGDGMETTGNLVAPDPMPDAPAQPEAVPDAEPPPPEPAPEPVGNLMPPEPSPVPPPQTPPKTPNE